MYNNYHNYQNKNKSVRNSENAKYSYGDKFVNPYNFIRLENKVDRTLREKGSLCGKLKCGIITKTQIFIPNTSNDRSLSIIEKDHKSFDYYSYTDNSKKSASDITNSNPEPVIPASEIRGVIRSVYETVTNSCMSNFEYNKTITAREKTFYTDCAILTSENDKWILYKAEKKGQIDLERNDLSKPKLYRDNDVAYVNAPGGAIDYKHPLDKQSKYIMTKTPVNLSKIINTLDDAVEKLKQVLKDYQNEKINRNIKAKTHFGYKNYKIQKGEYIPVWYKIRNNILYLSLASQGRIAYYHTLGDFADSYKPCSDKNALCRGCEMFGFVNTDTAESKSGKLNFYDAYVTEKKDVYTRGTKTLKELSSPKVSCLEMYTNKLSRVIDYWTYDYGMPKESVSDISKSIELNGRKFYWHNKKYADTAYTEEKNNRNMSIRPLNENVEFNYEITFQNLREDELEDLIFSINFGDNQNNNCHKIGAAKPLGLGSVKMTVNGVELRTISESGGKFIYNTEDKTAEYLKKAKTHELNPNLLKITNFDSMDGKNISYPIGEDQTKADPAKRNAGYNFFMWNRGESVLKPKFDKVLPDITSPDMKTRIKPKC